MNDTALTSERILEAAEDVLRRFGPNKATVVDVARALGVSHGSVYRHFPSKAALRDAVTEGWLHRVSAPLAEIAARKGPAPERLRQWFEALMAAKRRKVLDDPEMFATYFRLASDAREVVQAHVDELVGQIARIIEDGVKSGTFSVKDPKVAAKAVFDATARFHHPTHAAEWSDPGNEAAFEGVWALLQSALTAPQSKRR
jgi:AcrR family transcriptional regulator